MSIRSLEFVIPGDLQAATGGYEYDRRMIAGLRALGWRVTVHRLDASFPQPSAAALEDAQRVLARLPAQALVLVDGLAAGAMPQQLQANAVRLRLLALVHHPLACESGLAPQIAQRLKESEHRALQAVRHVFVTSAATKRMLRDYGVAADRVSVVQPGTDAAPPAHGQRGGTVRMLCVATLIPRKGHEMLLEALATLTDRRWHLTCVGSLARSPQTVERLRAQLQRLGLQERVTLAGEVDATALTQHYLESDLLVLPTHVEGYGMAVAEALAHGLPVIASSVGAIPELVGTRAGLLVAPGNTEQLRVALRRMLDEPALLDTLTMGALDVRGSLPGWDQACRLLASILEALDSEDAPDRR